MRAFRRAPGLLLLVGISFAAFAQAPTTTTVTPEKKALIDAPKNDSRTVQLGDTVTIHVSNDEVFRAAVGTGKATLFVNGQDTTIGPIDSATPNYVFRLERNDDNTKLWERILEAPFDQPVSEIHVSVGTNGKALQTADGVGTLKFRKSDVTSPAALIWIVIFIVVMIYFFHLARSTDILRNGPSAGGKKQSYSLGRSQMAWWLFIVIVSYVTIWMITGNRDTVTNSTLILLGISGGTALGAVAIDATASTRTKAAIDRLNTELTTLQAQLNAPGATNELKTALNVRIAAIQHEQATIVTEPDTKGWLTDILTDDNGAIALHRLQVVLWTFVLGIVFLVSVAHVLSMPVFNATLLALMGISSGTYLGFKMPTTG